MKSLFFVQREIPSIEPQFVLEVFGMPVASSTVTITAITLVILVWGLWFRSSLKKTGVQKHHLVVEMIADYTKDLTQQITGATKHFDRILPTITAIFVYLVIANLITYIPGITSITVGGMSLFGTPTADFNTTLGLAAGVVIVLQIISIMTFGIWGHLGKYIRIKSVIQGFKNGIGSGFTALVDMFVGLLDIVGEFAKIISLSLRLFGNMLAGNILAIVLLGAFAFVLPSVWLAFNILIGVLQALVFAALVGGYYMLAVEDDNA